MVDVLRLASGDAKRIFRREHLSYSPGEGTVAVLDGESKGGWMTIRGPANRFRRGLAAITESFTKLFAKRKPATQQYGSQRMCPFCGLITQRSKRFCLECGKPLRGAQVERTDARQG